MKRTALKRTPFRRKRAKALRYRLWQEFSNRIRARDKGCLMAGGGLGACGGHLQAAHIYPKGSWPLLMLYPLNVITLCWRHHFGVWHKSPGEAWAWLNRTLPRVWRDRLEAMRIAALARKGMSEAELRLEWEVYGI